MISNNKPSQNRALKSISDKRSKVCKFQEDIVVVNIVLRNSIKVQVVSRY